jgi:hypothetical protein
MLLLSFSSLCQSDPCKQLLDPNRIGSIVLPEGKSWCDVAREGGSAYAQCRCKHNIDAAANNAMRQAEIDNIYAQRDALANKANEARQNAYQINLTDDSPNFEADKSTMIAYLEKYIRYNEQMIGLLKEMNQRFQLDNNTSYMEKDVAHTRVEINRLREKKQPSTLTITETSVNLNISDPTVNTTNSTINSQDHINSGYDQNQEIDELNRLKAEVARREREIENQKIQAAQINQAKAQSAIAEGDYQRAAAYDYLAATHAQGTSFQKEAAVRSLVSIGAAIGSELFGNNSKENWSSSQRDSIDDASRRMKKIKRYFTADFEARKELIDDFDRNNSPKYLIADSDLSFYLQAKGEVIFKTRSNFFKNNIVDQGFVEFLNFIKNAELIKNGYERYLVLWYHGTRSFNSAGYLTNKALKLYENGDFDGAKTNINKAIQFIRKATIITKYFPDIIGESVMQNDSKYRPLFHKKVKKEHNFSEIILGYRSMYKIQLYQKSGKKSRAEKKLLYEAIEDYLNLSSDKIASKLVINLYESLADTDSTDKFINLSEITNEIDLNRFSFSRDQNALYDRLLLLNQALLAYNDKSIIELELVIDKMKNFNTTYPDYKDYYEVPVRVDDFLRVEEQSIVKRKLIEFFNTYNSSLDSSY